MERYLSCAMMFFLMLGVLDRVLLGGKMGLGAEFEKGFHSVGTLILSMAGIMCAAPVLGKGLSVAAAPVFSLFGADPAMAAGCVFAIDMGGFPLAQTMTQDPQVQILSGVVLASMMGATIVFLIPVSMTICRKEDMEALSKGVVIGLIAIPAGMFAGAAAAGISLQTFLVNSVPVFGACVVLAVCLIAFQAKTMACFRVFGRLLQAFGLLSLAAASIEEVLGISVVAGMASLEEQLRTIGVIGVTLAGAYPMLAVLTRLLNPVLSRIASLLLINPAAVQGMVAALANPIPLFETMHEMDARGKVVAMAFAVPVMAVFGDHLGYVGAAMPSAMVPMIAAKLAGGAVAVILAEIFESASRFGKKKGK